MADAKEPPKKERRFIHIVEQEGGTVDVYLNPEVVIYPIADGFKEYDASVHVVRGVVPWDGMEDDIRARFQAWCDSAEVIDL